MGNMKSSHSNEAIGAEIQANQRRLQANHERLEAKTEAIQKKMESIREMMQQNQEMLETKIDTTVHVIEEIVEDTFTNFLSGIKQSAKNRPKVVQKTVSVKESHFKPRIVKEIKKTSPIAVKTTFDRGSIRQHQIETQLNVQQDKTPRTTTTSRSTEREGESSRRSVVTSRYGTSAPRKSADFERASKMSRQNNYAQMLSKAGAAAAADSRKHTRPGTYSGSFSR
jgi:predicted nuclease with TOPRIM domain